MTLHGTPFLPGNKFGRGRPKGSRNKLTRAAQRLIEENAESLARKCIAAALRGDMKAMALCFPYLLSANRLSVTKLRLPSIQTADDIASALDAILKAVAHGKRTAADGQMLASILEGRRRVIEDRDVAVRLLELERRLKEPEGVTSSESGPS
jgi:hypothetical protein